MIEIDSKDLWMLINGECDSAYIMRHNECGSVMEWFPDWDESNDAFCHYNHGLLRCPKCKKRIVFIYNSFFGTWKNNRKLTTSSKYYTIVFNPDDYDDKLKKELAGKILKDMFSEEIV